MPGNININVYAYKKQADVIQRDKWKKCLPE